MKGGKCTVSLQAIKTPEDRWLRIGRSDLQLEAEVLICAAHEQALKTNYVKCRIDNIIKSDKCRMCGKRGEMV